MFESLRKLRGERLPDLGISAAFVAGDNSALLVDHEDVRLVRRTERPRAVAIRIGNRRPAPTVALDEISALLWGVRNIEPEKRELRMIAVKLCVGDRLALAGASPRRPDVYEHLSTPELGKGDLLAVEGGSHDRRCLRTRSAFGSSGLRRRGNRRGCILIGAAPAAGDEERAQGQEKRERPHAGQRSLGRGPLAAVQDFVRGS